MDRLLLRAAEVRFFVFVHASYKRTGDYNEVVYLLDFILKVNKKINGMFLKSALNKVMNKDITIRPGLAEMVQLYRELGVPIRQARARIGLSPNKYYRIVQLMDKSYVIHPKLPYEESLAVFEALKYYDTLADYLRQEVDLSELHLEG